METNRESKAPNKRRKGLWAEFLKRKPEVEREYVVYKRGERMKSLAGIWKDKMSGLTTVSVEYLMLMKKEQEEMKYLITAKNAEIKDLNERVLYLEGVLNVQTESDSGQE